MKEAFNEVAAASWDWKDGEGAAKSIKAALKQLGLFVYQAPSYEGIDGYGIIISKIPLTEAGVAKWDERLQSGGGQGTGDTSSDSLDW